MHAVMLENLEEYLAGTLEPVEVREIEAHLSLCGTCREEIRGMREVSGLMGTLQPDTADIWDVAPGFAARVLAQVAQRKPAPVFAGFFSLNMAFGRRLVFASMLVLAVFGGYLVTHEAQYPVGPSPEAILAQQNAPAFETGGAANNMLATLTAYEQ